MKQAVFSPLSFITAYKAGYLISGSGGAHAAVLH